MTTETYHQDFFEFSSINEHHHELEMSEKRWAKCCHQLKKIQCLSHLSKLYLCNSVSSNQVRISFPQTPIRRIWLISLGKIIFNPTETVCEPDTNNI